MKHRAYYLRSLAVAATLAAVMAVGMAASVWAAEMPTEPRD
jgi:hypothetical protein